jgi:hypothetical protein
MLKLNFIRSTYFFLFYFTLQFSGIAQIQISKKGKAGFSIFVEKADVESVQEAAKDLQRIFKKGYGIDISINNSLQAPCIAMGKAAMKLSSKTKSFSHDQGIIEEKDGNLLLYGLDEDIQNGYNLIEASDFYKFYNVQRWRRTLSAGTYNAYVQFVTEHLGVRWYMPGEMGEHIPELKNLTIAKGYSKKTEPYFIQRRLDFADWTRGKMNETKKADSYHKRANTDETVKWSRHLRLTNPVVLENGHGWRQWIPADQIVTEKIQQNTSIPKEGYGKTKPEFFALVGGQRQARYTSKVQHGGQLCMSNQELIATYAKNIIDYNKANPSVKIFSLSQNDGGSHCECDNCKAWDSSPQDMSKSSIEYNITDRFLKFQKAVADIVIKEIPDAKFSAISYHETRLPPSRETVPDNFYIQGFYNYYPYLYNIEHERKELEQTFEGWSKKSKNFMYSTFYFAYGNYGLPWSSIDAQKWLIDNFKKNDIRYFETIYEGDYPMIGQTGPDTWITSQLLWNPNQKLSDLENEWYTNCFGKEAGKNIKEYYKIINNAYKDVLARNPKFLANRSQNQSNHNAEVYAMVKDKASKLIENVKLLAPTQPSNVQWRIKQITQTWDFCELTHAGIAASKTYRKDTKPENFASALALGKAREEIKNNPDNVYSVCKRCVDVSENSSNLNIISKEMNYEKVSVTIPKIAEDFSLGSKTLKEWEPFTNSVGRKMDKQVFRNIQTTQLVEGNLLTIGRLCYSNSGIYLFFNMAEPKMTEQIASTVPGKPWNGDAFEVFLSPSGAKDEYFQFTVNPNGITATNAKKGDTGMDKNYKPNFNYKVNKGPNSWGVQLFIPFESIGGKPKAGDSWKANFCRIRMTDLRENSAWSPTGSNMFAVPEMFGTMVFGE